MGFDLKNKKGIVILENTANGLDALGNAYLQNSLAQLGSDIFDVADVDEEKLQRLNGRYELVPGFIMMVTNEQQQLYIQATGQGKFPVKAKSDLVFVNLNAGAKITFELDDNNQAVALTLDQGGMSRKAKKLSAEDPGTQMAGVSLTEEQLENLVGNFELMPNFILTTSHEDGQLVIQATGQQKILMVTTSKSEFFNDLIQAKIVFKLDESGKAVSLILFQAGQELKGVKK